MLEHVLKAMRCIHPGCSRFRKLRGLCHGCYDRLRQEIRHGRTTFEQATVDGRCLAANKGAQQRWVKGVKA